MNTSRIFQTSLTLLAAILALALPTACIDEDEAPATPQGNFEALWRIMDEHYCFFEQKGVDWDEVHERYKQQMDSHMTESQQFEVLCNMLSEPVTAMSTCTHPSTWAATGPGARIIRPTSLTRCRAAISAPTTA